MNSIPSLAAQSPESAEPASAKFHSPPKKRQLHELIPEKLEKLQKEHLARPPKRRRIPAPLFSSATLDGIEIPDKLKPTVQAIEDYAQNLGHIVRTEAQALMAKILESQCLTLEEKEIELGLLYFYLTAHKNLPTQLPLWEARLEEIEAEALLLQQEHVKACYDIKEIPSGAFHYIQRAFFHMIFSENGAFNTGGCLAVQRLLTQSRLNLLLTEEARTRMLTTVTLLLEDAEFKDLFMQPLTVHPTLKKVISLDIKKSSKESLSAIEIRWALLMQFFSLIGQTGEGNCYAVASYLNLLNEHPKVLLNMTIELLKTGKLEFEGVDIPVHLIMGNRLQWEKDFTYAFTIRNAYALTPVVVAQNALGIQTIQKPSHPSDYSLNALLSHAFGTATEEAKQLFAAHKFNMVQQMMLSVLQFIAKNTTATREGVETVKVEMFRELREMYLPFFLQQLKRAGIDQDDEIDIFFARFDAEIYKRMYRVDMRNWRHFTRGDRIIFENHAVGLKIKEEDLNGNPFKLMTRLYIHKEGNFLPIERISEFGTYMAECVDGAIGSAPSAKVEKTASLLKSFLSSLAFQLSTAHWLEMQNKEAGNNLDADVYSDSDSFFLNAKGSWAFLITDFDPLYAAYAPRLTFSSTDVKDFFKNLCSQMRDIVKADPAYQKGEDHKIIMNFPGHSFNLTPNRFSSYWESEDDLLTEKVALPAQNLLAATLSENQKGRILAHFEGSKAKTTYASFLSRPMSAKEFKEEMLTQIPAEKQAPFKAAFNTGLQEIVYSDFKEKAKNLLETLGRPLTKEEKAQVARYFGKKHKKLSYLSPYQAAKLLKNALLTLQSPVVIPAYKLEIAIRELYGLPQVVPIANLNWVAKQAEHLKYSTLVIQQDLAGEAIIFSKRSGGRDFVFQHTDLLIQKTGLIPNRPPAQSGEKV